MSNQPNNWHAEIEADVGRYPNLKKPAHVRTEDGSAITGWGAVVQEYEIACLLAAAPELLSAVQCLREHFLHLDGPLEVSEILEVIDCWCAEPVGKAVAGRSQESE